jgi:hypothetical protein
MQRYRLSNQQQKQLMIRGQTITIAIPVPPGERGCDRPDFVRKCLPELSSEIEIESGIVSLPVFFPAADIGIDGSTTILGRLVEAVNTVPMQVVVCVARLTPPRCRGEQKNIQWPGFFLDND